MPAGIYSKIFGNYVDSHCGIPFAVSLLFVLGLPTYIPLIAQPRVFSGVVSDRSRRMISKESPRSSYWLELLPGTPSPLRTFMNRCVGISATPYERQQTPKPPDLAQEESSL